MDDALQVFLVSHDNEGRVESLSAASEENEADVVPR